MDEMVRRKRLICPISLIGFMGVSAAAIIITVGLYHRVLLPLASIGWDEGAHLLDTLAIFNGLHNGSMTEAVRASFVQVFYPPAYSWFAAIWGLVVGPSVTGFRSWSLAAFILSGVLIYLTAFKLLKSLKYLKGEQTIGALIAAGLFLTAPLYWFYSTLAMLEVTGALATLAVGWLIVRAGEKDDKSSEANKPDKANWTRWAVAGTALALVNLVKYNYALIILAAIIGDAVIGLYLSDRKDLTNKGYWQKEALRLIAILAPYIAVISLWIVLPGRWNTYVNFLKEPNPYSYPFVSLADHLFGYYPSSIIFDYLASPLLAILILAGIFSFWHFGIVRKERSIRIIGLIFLANLVMATLHLNNQQERYLATTVPMLYILSGVGAVTVYRAAKEATRRLERKAITVITFITIIIIIIFTAVITRDLAWDVGHIEGIGEHLANSPIYASADYHDTLFSFNRSDWPHGPRLAETPVDIVNWIVANTDPAKPLVYGGATNEISPPVVEFLRALRREESNKTNKSDKANKLNDEQEYAFTLEVAPTSVLAGYDYQRMNRLNTEAGLAAISGDPSWQKIAEKNFSSLGVAAAVWAR